MENRKQEFQVNCIRICIDEQTNEKLAGKLVGVALEHEILFQTTAQLVVQIEEAFNKIGKPQTFQVLRSFNEKGKKYTSYNGNPKRYHTSEEIRTYTGKKKTIDFLLISRHHAEWQGLLKEPDGSVIGEFKSILEFIELAEVPFMMLE